MKKIQNNFGNNFRLIREANKWTQRDIATKLNVTPQSISKWENSLCYPDVEYIYQICEIFKTDFNALFMAKEYHNKFKCMNCIYKNHYKLIKELMERC